MALGVLLTDMMGIVGTDQGDARLLMDLQQAPVDLRLLRDAVVLEFQIEIIRAKDLLHLQGVRLGAFVIAVEDALGDLPGQTCGQGD